MDSYAATDSDDGSLQLADSDMDLDDDAGEAVDVPVCEAVGHTPDAVEGVPDSTHGAMTDDLAKGAAGDVSSGEEALTSTTKQFGKRILKAAELLCIECVNVTRMETPLDALIASRASVVFTQEHKIRQHRITGDPLAAERSWLAVTPQPVRRV